MSTSIGAPAAFARSLGHSDITNGTATATAPSPPTTDVAPIRKRRLSLFTTASVPIPTFRAVSLALQNLRIIRDLPPRFAACARACFGFAGAHRGLALGTAGTIIAVVAFSGGVQRVRADYNDQF